MNTKSIADGCINPDIEPKPLHLPAEMTEVDAWIEHVNDDESSQA